MGAPPIGRCQLGTIELCFPHRNPSVPNVQRPTLQRSECPFAAWKYWRLGGGVVLTRRLKQLNEWVRDFVLTRRLKLPNLAISTHGGKIAAPDTGQTE